MLINITLMALFSRRRQQTLDAMSNEDLIKEFNQGRAEAFAIIVHRLERPLFLFILKRIQDEDTAREILQDTFMKLTQHAHRYDPSSPLSAWLYTIARNRTIDYLRKLKKKQKEQSIDAPIHGEDSLSWHQLLADQAPRSAELIENKEFLEKLNQALENINPDQREIFLMREIQGLKFHEIAESLDLSENTVKSRMRYALEAIRKHLSDFIPQESSRFSQLREEA